MEIRGIDGGMLAEYGLVPIAYEVRSRVDVDELLRSGAIVEIQLKPYWKDYDLQPGNSLAELAARLDLSQCGVFGCFEDGSILGGAIVAPGFEYEIVENRPEAAVLVDLRVRPDARRRGAGRALFKSACSWARAAGFGELLVETQDVNVGACRFYRAMRLQVFVVDREAYPGLDEAMIIWRFALFLRD